jgi:choline-glycine betaine transporter
LRQARKALEVHLFSWEDIPWTELAFPSVAWALEHYRATKDLAVFAPGTNPA